jgi:integrase
VGGGLDYLLRMPDLEEKLSPADPDDLAASIDRMNSGDRKWLDPASGTRVTAHGFGATLKTWADEAATFPHAVVEMALGHQVGNAVERSYRRTDLLEKRRELMGAWARHCEPRGGDWAKIVELNPRRA